MRSAVEEIVAITERLGGVDPGDQARLCDLLKRRGELLDQLAASICAGGVTATEADHLMERLRAVSLMMAKPYRSVVLDRLLTLQRLAQLSRQKALLSALSAGRTDRAGEERLRATG